MAEQKNSMPPRRPGGPGHGPRSHGYQRPQDLRGTVKKLLHYVGRYKGLLVLVAVCLLLSSVGSVASSYFLKPAINNYILPGDFAGLLKLLVLMGLVFVLSALCSYVYSRIMVRVSQRTVAALRQDLFDKLQELPLRYFDTHQSGDLMSRFTNDIDTVSEMINNSFANVLSNSLTFLCTIGMLLYLNWALTLITFAFLGLMLLVVKVIGGRSRVSFQRQQAALGDLNGYIEEMIEGQKVIKVFHHEQQAIDQFSARNDDLSDGGHHGPDLRRVHDARHRQPLPHQLRRHLLRRRTAGHGRRVRHRLSGGLSAVRQAGVPAGEPDQPAGEHHSGRHGRRRAHLRRHGGPAGGGRGPDHHRPGGEERRYPHRGASAHRPLGMEEARRLPDRAAGRRALRPRHLRLRSG